MYILFDKQEDVDAEVELETPIDLDAVVGDIISCMQSPECTDTTPV